jgi:hypothetical protein
MIEGSGAGSALVTNGSGSGSERPKNVQIQIRNATVDVNGYDHRRTLERNGRHLQTHFYLLLKRKENGMGRLCIHHFIGAWFW